MEDGRKITPEMVLDGYRSPIKVCYCTDTQPMDDVMADFAHGADLLISEGMYDDDGMLDKMMEKGHMLFSDSARLAKKSDAKQLWLTHFSPALTEPVKKLEDVRKIFPETVVAYDGIHLTL